MRLILLFSFVISCQCFCQDLVLVNQNRELILEKPLRFEVTVPKASDTIGFTLTKGRVKFRIDPDYNFVRLRVTKDLCVKEYYNEFTEDQFSKLDTLELFESCIKHGYTPLIPFENFEEWLADTLEYKWFKDYLDELDFNNSDKRIEINVQTSYSTLLFKKNKIKRMKEDIANAFGVSPEKIVFKFNKEHYVTRDEDLFLAGQTVDKKYIRNQNTPYMRKLAKKYKLVGNVGIVEQPRL